jgi:hypothetical protein
MEALFKLFFVAKGSSEGTKKSECREPDPVAVKFIFV